MAHVAPSPNTASTQPPAESVAGWSSRFAGISRVALPAILSVILLLLGGTMGCGGGERVASNLPKVAYVTNGIASFWNIAEVGAKDAGRDFGVEVSILMPPNGVADQQRMVQEALARGVKGVAISPIDPDNQGDLLKEIAANAKLVTQDSDAPNSPRLAYVGMDNYEAGRMCGRLVKEALPNGGDVMLFVGRLGQANARLRRQGVIDELLDRSPDPQRFDPPGQELKGERYTILDTRIDNFDFTQAKSLAQDALARYPNLGAMVGLFAYNPPKLLEAAREANRIGKVQIIAFDEDQDTLDGIAAGAIHGTIVQDPYRYGYESVRILAGLVKGDDSVLPEGGVLDIPARMIRRDQVEAFRNELTSKLERAKSAMAPAPDPLSTP